MILRPKTAACICNGCCPNRLPNNRAIKRVDNRVVRHIVKYSRLKLEFKPIKNPGNLGLSGVSVFGGRRINYFFNQVTKEGSAPYQQAFVHSLAFASQLAC